MLGDCGGLRVDGGGHFNSCRGRGSAGILTCCIELKVGLLVESIELTRGSCKSRHGLVLNLIQSHDPRTREGRGSFWSGGLVLS
jgi:hypothetical protein